MISKPDGASTSATFAILHAQVKALAAAALKGAESDKIKCESLTHLARAHHADGELEAAFKYYRQVHIQL